jgi:hypothetical protein
MARRVAHGFQIAVLAGDDPAGPGLEPFSTVSAKEDSNGLWSYLTEGGERNLARFATLCRGAGFGWKSRRPLNR